MQHWGVCTVSTMSPAQHPERQLRLHIHNNSFIHAVQLTCKVSTMSHAHHLKRQLRLHGHHNSFIHVVQFSCTVSTMSRAQYPERQLRLHVHNNIFSRGRQLTCTVSHVSCTVSSTPAQTACTHILIHSGTTIYMHSQHHVSGTAS